MFPLYNGLHQSEEEGFGDLHCLDAEIYCRTTQVVWTPYVSACGGVGDLLHPL